MTSFKRIIISTLCLAIVFTIQAITPDEFYDKCSGLPNCTKMSIPSLILKSKDKNLHQLKIVTAEDLDSTTISMLKQELSHIASLGNASSIKSTDGDDWSRIIIVSNEKDVDILISAIDSDDISLVYISCNEEIVGEILNKYANK